MKSNHKIILAILILFGIVLMATAGCGTKTVTGTAYEKKIPKTPQAAGIKTYDSTSCEGCHTDAQAISTFEKPKANSSGPVSEGG